MDDLNDWNSDARCVDNQGLGSGRGLKGWSVEFGQDGLNGGRDGEVREVEGKALGVTEVDAGGGFPGVVGVVELASEFVDTFEDDDGRAITALAEVEAKEEVVAVRTDWRAEVQGSSPFGVLEVGCTLRPCGLRVSLRQQGRRPLIDR